MIKLKALTPEQKIVAHLEKNGQKMTWLADILHITPGHLHSVLKGEGIAKRDLTEENRSKINAALGTNY